MKLILTVALLTGLSWPSPGLGEPVFVVVNANTKVASLAPADLRDIYLGKKTHWSDGTRIKPVRLPNSSPATKRFLDQFVGKSLDEYLGYWRRRLFSGDGIPPTIAEDEDSLTQKVGLSNGSIGYATTKTPLPNVIYIDIRG